MKKILLIGICASMALAAAAQNAWSSSAPARRIEWGPRLGLNVSSMSNLSMNPRAGVNVGMAVNFGIVESMYINTGVFFSMKGANGNFEGVTNNGEAYKYMRTYNPMYIQIPVQASFRYDFNPDVQWQLNFGPYFGVGVAGKFKLTDAGETVRDDHLFGSGDGHLDCHRFDFGLGIGTGVSIRDFVITINYDFGLTNVYSFKGYDLTMTDGEYTFTQKNKSVRNGVFTLSVGYNF